MRIKVVSLNLWHGGRLLEGILDFIKQENPDILMCQEAYNGTDPALLERQRSVETLQKHFAFPAVDFAAAMQSKKLHIDQGNAVFSRFPISNRDVTFLEGSYRVQDMVDRAQFPFLPRNLQHVTLTTSAGEINVFNFHGVWDLDGDNYSDKRRAMSEIITRETRGKSRVILAGDTNAKPTNQAMRNLGQHLVSVFGASLTSTFNMRRKDNPGYAAAAVDMMYVSHDITVVSKKCPDVDISDHLPLVVELDI
ncbi:MAG: endonuclease/exonuclease/phosphatase family protein [Candidatus Saccharimonadales bacterium]